MGASRRTPVVALAVAAGLTLLAPAAVGADRDFDAPASSDTAQQFAPGNVQRQDTPNDPGYDAAEPDDEDGGGAGSLYAERYDLFGFPSGLTPLAVYKDGPHAGQPMVSGFNAAGAWKRSRGRPDVAVAVLDTGVDWSDGRLRRQVRLNTAELPKPRNAVGVMAPTYDRDADGAVTVDDWAQDSRVAASAPGKPTGRDLIRAFSDGRDDDGNGYTDDIAGWDFFDDDNDPTDASSYFLSAGHGTGRAREVAEQGDDGTGALGVCPRCQVVPLRIWDVFVSDANTVGLAMLYAADNGVAVIEAANGSVYHSAFTEAASEYAYRHGLVQVYSGDDLNTANHNYPANYDHTILVQGTIPDTAGAGASPFADQLAGLPSGGADLPVLTYFRGANTTQYGGHSSFAMEGATGSENTGKAAGAAALVISAARAAGVRPTPDEVRELLEQTAEDVTAATTLGAGVPDFAQDGWDPHFGYGRVDVGRAVGVAGAGKAPPEASIRDPDWYAPLAGPTVRVRGLARAARAPAGRLHWKLEWGPGLAPTSWTTVREADAAGTVTDFGTLDLAAVRAAMASYSPPVDGGGPVFSALTPSPFSGQFALRLTVTASGAPLPGVDRKVLTVLDDATLRAGFPRRLGAGGEAQGRYADLDGDGVQELVLPTMDGLVHAFRRAGGELAGWPVRTREMRQAAAHPGAPGIRALRPALPAREPPRGVTIVDLDGDGTQEVVVPAGTRLYVWGADGSPRPGFPVQVSLAECAPDRQSQPLRHPKCGFLASASAGRFEGKDKPFGLVVPALDGRLYGWRHDGSPLPHFPVRLQDPAVPAAQRMVAESINSAAVADLDGDGRDDAVVATNEVYGVPAPAPGDIAGGIAQGVAEILANATGGSTRVYAVSGATGAFLPGWPYKLTGAGQTLLPMIGPGHDPALATVGGRKVVLMSATGSAISLVGTDGTLVRAMETQAYGPASDAVDRTGGFNLFESAVVGDVTGAGRPAVVKYVLSLGGVANLLVAGQNIPYNHLVGGWDAQTGVPLPAFPRVTDDFQFVSASTIAKVDPAGPAQQVLAQTGLGTLHAYDGLTGLDAPGFPKLTGGWLVAPAALAADGRLAAVTREGFLFEWATAAPPCAQTEWPAYRHDARGTGDLDADGTPPAAPLDVRLQPGAEPEVTFTTPGDDLGCGTATSYVVVVDGVRSVLAGEVAAAGTRVTRRLSLPAGTRELRLFAVDEAGNAGPAAVLSLRAARPSVPGGGLATTGGGLASVLLGCLLVAALLALRRSRHA